MIDLGQLKHLIVEPTLATIGLRSVAAVNLVTGTALVESNATYLQQMGGGPALGLWQMEPATEEDCWNTFLDMPEQVPLRDAVISVMSDEAGLTQLISNLRYSCAMCRIKYWRSPLELPIGTDAPGLANYHKAVYNTVLGAADAEKNVPLFQQAIDA